MPPRYDHRDVWWGGVVRVRVLLFVGCCSVVLWVVVVLPAPRRRLFGGGGWVGGGLHSGRGVVLGAGSPPGVGGVVFPLLFRPPLGSLGVGGGGGGVCLCWPVSTSRLRPLPVFHVWPIDPVVCWGPSSSTGCCCGDLVLKVVSRLDAFSGYPVRT